LDNLYKRYGLPDSIISDRDSRFTARSFRELLQLLGVKQKFTTAYHPQSDRTTECFNQEIEAYISICCSSNPETWNKAIGMLEFTHNNQQHSDRQRTSFELIRGTSPITVPLSFKNTKYPSTEDQIRKLVQEREEALAAHELARSTMASRRKNCFTPFKKGDLVWLDTCNLKMNYHKKMAPK
jgi:transposase InsO family protein